MLTMDDMLAIVKPHNDKIVADAETARFRDALERIALLDEADGHELALKHAFRAVAIACIALGNKHPSQILVEREARVKAQ